MLPSCPSAWKTKPTSVRMTRTELSEFDITATQFWNNPAGSWRDVGLCLATRDQYPALYLAPAQTARYKQIQGPSTCRCRVILYSNGHPCAIRSECIHCSTIACCCPKLRAWEPMHAKSVQSHQQSRRRSQQEDLHCASCARPTYLVSMLAPRVETRAR